MSAGVERIADVVVEFVPGDRELAERIAGAVWERLRGVESHGGDSVPDRAASAGDRRTEPLSGNQTLRDNNMWAFGYEAGYVAGQQFERARKGDQA